MVMLRERLAQPDVAAFVSTHASGEPKVEPHALVIAGSMGTYQGMEAQKEAFGRHYIGGVTIFNSAVLSSDPTNRRRFAQMRDVVEGQIEDGVSVHGVFHSTAISESSIPMRRMRRAGFFDEPSNAEKLHITLISPASTGGVLGPLRFLGRAARYAREEAEIPGTKKKTLLRGVETLAAFPPIYIEDDILTKGIRKALPELSHYKEGVQVLPFTDTQPNTPYLTKPDLLTMGQQIKMGILDAALKEAIIRGDIAKVREVIRDRGELLRRPLNAMYSGALAVTSQIDHEATGSIVGGTIDMLHVVGRSMVNAPLREFARLNQKGVHVDEVVPEYDIWRSPEEALAFYASEQDAASNVYISSRDTHATHALQAERFARTMRQLYDRSH